MRAGQGTHSLPPSTITHDENKGETCKQDRPQIICKIGIRSTEESEFLAGS